MFDMSNSVNRVKNIDTLIRVNQKEYERLRDLKYHMRARSYSEVIGKLIEADKKRKVPQ